MRSWPYGQNKSLVALLHLLHQFIYSPSDVQTSQVTVVLSNPEEDHRDASGMYHADQSPHHVADSIALRDDEAIHADTVVPQLALREVVSYVLDREY